MTLYSNHGGLIIIETLDYLEMRVAPAQLNRESIFNEIVDLYTSEVSKCFVRHTNSGEASCIAIVLPPLIIKPPFPWYFCNKPLLISS